MRNGHHQHQQQKRMRGRNRNNRSHNPLTRVYESNGPDVKVRGTAHHIAEKYIQLARDSQASGDPVSSEGYLQHAEHYFRLIAAAQAQFAQQNPHQPQQPYQRPDMEGGEEFEEGGGDESAPSDPNAQPYTSSAPVQRQQHQPGPQQNQPQPNFQGQPQQRNDQQNSGGGLPAFITGGGANAQGGQYDNEQGDRGNRNDRNDRFGRNRNRRFRHGGGNHGGGNQGPGNYDNRGGFQGDNQPQQNQGGQNAAPAAGTAQPNQPGPDGGGSQPPDGSGPAE
jgi:hypothetical protein